MSRIGINVPDDLLARLRPFKKSLNVSEICRAALERQAEAYERAKKRLVIDDLGSLVERFLKERADLEVDWQSIGIEDAKVWFELAPYKKVKDLFYKLSFVGRKGMLQSPSLNIVPHVEGVPIFDDRWTKYDERTLELHDRESEQNNFSMAFDEYQLGWFSYQRTVKSHLDDALSKDAEHRSDDSKKRRQNVMQSAADGHG